MVTTNVTTKTVLTPASTNEVLGVKDGVLGRFELAAMKTAMSLDQVTNASLLLAKRYSMPPSQWKIGAIGNSLIETSNSFISTACSRVGAVIKEKLGVGGANTAALAAQAAALPADCTHCFILEGTNDAAQGVSTATHIANIRTAANVLIAAGIAPILIASPTRSVSAAQALVMSKYSLAERIYADTDGILFVDPWARFINADGTGVWASGISDDGDHPNLSGNYQIGVDLAVLLAARSSGYLVPRVDGYATNDGLLYNPLGILDTNANGLPDGWGAFGMSGTYALATASSPMIGKKCTATISQTATVELYREVNVNSGFVVGDKLRVVGLVTLASMSNCSFRAYVRPVGSSSTDRILLLERGNVTTQYLSCELTVPAATTSIQLWLEVSSLGGAYTCNLTFSNFQIFNVTTYTY